MASREYVTGIIKVKDADGRLKPYLPATDVTLVTDENGTTLAQRFADIAEQLESAGNKSSVEIMTEMPTEANTSEFPNETLIAWMDV